LALVFACLGVGFAFLGLFDHLKVFKGYFSATRQAGYLHPSLNGFVEVKEISQNAVFLKDGSGRAILQVLPIHFSLLSTEEQRAIVTAYRDFLNSLDFPVQVVMRTINLSLKEYLAVLQKKVEKENKKGLLEQFESFQSFVQRFIREKKIKNRLFYVIIPVSPSRSPTNWLVSKKADEKAMLDQLDIRVKVCQDKLKRCNLLSNHLNTQELVSLSASFFEGFIEAQNDYFAHVTTLKESEKNAEKETKRTWFGASGTGIKRNNDRDSAAIAVAEQDSSNCSRSIIGQKN